MPATKKKAKASKTTKKAPTVKKKVAKKAAVTKKAPVKKKTVAKTAVAKKVVEKAAVKKKAPVTKKTVAKKVTKRPPAGATKLEGSSVSFTPYKPKRGEDYMSEDQGQHFRDLLDDWKQELMTEVDRTVHHMQDDATHFPDPNDRATQESEFSLELRTRDRERKLIRKIDESLSAIDTDEYGYCESCGVEIGLRRLEARPTATQCIDCKMLDEIREKQWR
jgi:DnaK suppressor protein